jgi:hypothetical protein
LRNPPAAGGPLPSFRHEALYAGPGFDQGAVDRKVLARQQLTDLCRFRTAVMNLHAISPPEKPIPVLAEYCGVPHRIIRTETDEPTEQQIIL